MPAEVLARPVAGELQGLGEAGQFEAVGGIDLREHDGQPVIQPLGVGVRLYPCDLAYPVVARGQVRALIDGRSPVDARRAQSDHPFTFLVRQRARQ